MLRRLYFYQETSVMKSILFVCIHNSARSQMAEAFINHRFGDRFHAKSAGLESGTLNPVVVEAMKEIDIDISNNATKTVDDILATKESFDYVVTVCDEANAERCPVFPGPGERIHWGFPDPSALQGAADDKLARTRVIRDAIQDRLSAWASSV